MLLVSLKLATFPFMEMLVPPNQQPGEMPSSQGFWQITQQTTTTWLMTIGRSIQMRTSRGLSNSISISMVQIVSPRNCL